MSKDTSTSDSAKVLGKAIDFEVDLNKKYQGTVDWFNYTRGYGFIRVEDCNCFVHHKSISKYNSKKSLKASLGKGETVEFLIRVSKYKDDKKTDTTANDTDEPKYEAYDVTGINGANVKGSEHARIKKKANRKQETSVNAKNKAPKLLVLPVSAYPGRDVSGQFFLPQSFNNAVVNTGFYPNYDYHLNPYGNINQPYQKEQVNYKKINKYINQVVAKKVPKA